MLIMALLEEEKINKVIKLAKKNFEYTEKWKQFFEDSFTKYDNDMQLYTIALFIKYNKTSFYNFLQKNDVYKTIFSATSNCLINFNNIEFDNIVKDNMELILYIDDLDSKNIFTSLKILQSNKDKFDYGNMITFFVKNILYNLDEKDAQLKNSREAGYIDLTNNIIIEYLNQCDLKDMRVLDNITLFIEASHSKEFSKLKRYMTERGNNQDILNYSEYFKKNKIVEEEKLNSFIQALINYKFVGGQFSIEWQRYLYKNYMDNPIITKLVTSDIINSYLNSNGINDACFFHDKFLSIGAGLAGTKFYAVKSNDISRDIFHEATHIIQKNSINNQNYIGDNYNFLKDLIIQHNISRHDYLLNHDNFNFEMDADYKGSCLCFEFLYPISDINIQQQLKQEKIDIEIDNEKRRNNSNLLNISGNIVSKREFFDSLLLSQPGIVQKYPILKNEYKNDGSRKTDDEILDYMYELKKMNFPLEQLEGIKNCIFGSNVNYSNGKKI
jgi:hypothetical protein